MLFSASSNAGSTSRSVRNVSSGKEPFGCNVIHLFSGYPDASCLLRKDSVMDELTPYNSPLPSLLTPGGRALTRDLAAVRRATSVGLAKGDGLAAFTDQAMGNLAALDMQRRLLARGDETLNNLLMEVEIGHVMCVLDEQRGMYRRY